MTQAADIIRDRRRHLARPGGAHDRLVRSLAIALPVAIGAVVAVLVIAPLFTRGELSFLLDRKKVAVTGQRLRVDNAAYRGQDNKGREFMLVARNASQPSAKEPLVRMNDLSARILLTDGPATLTAPQGDYQFDKGLIAISGPVVFAAQDGYRITTSNVSVDLKQQHVVGSGGVSGAIPAGTFSAERVTADLDDRVITLEGNARLTMVPGKIRVPQ
jgi:lipopolysaccharide export system protein LptC